MIPLIEVRLFYPQNVGRGDNSDALACEAGYSGCNSRRSTQKRRQVKITEDLYITTTNFGGIKLNKTWKEEVETNREYDKEKNITELVSRDTLLARYSITIYTNTDSHEIYSDSFVGGLKNTKKDADKYEIFIKEQFNRILREYQEELCDQNLTI